MPEQIAPKGSPIEVHATGHSAQLGDEAGDHRLGRALKLGVLGLMVAGVAYFLLRPSTPASNLPPAIREVARLEAAKDTTGLAAKVASPNEAVAVRAVQGLGSIGGDEAARQITQAMSDSRAPVRAMAAIQYAATGDSNVLPLTTALQTDQSIEVRAAAAEAIGRMRSFDGIESLLRGLMDRDVEVRRASIAAIEQVLPGMRFNYDPTASPEERARVAESIRRQYPKWKANYDLMMQRLKQQGEQ